MQILTVRVGLGRARSDKTHRTSTTIIDIGRTSVHRRSVRVYFRHYSCCVDDLVSWIIYP